jgi:hypothetical protein
MNERGTWRAHAEAHADPSHHVGPCDEACRRGRRAHVHMRAPRPKKKPTVEKGYDVWAAMMRPIVPHDPVPHDRQKCPHCNHPEPRE